MLLLALAAVTAAVYAVPAWQRTVRREAYLPDLEAQVQKSPYDGALLALLGARLMEAAEYPAAASALHGALAAGEQNEAVWRTTAAATAAAGDRTRALADLRLGLQALPGSMGLQAALAGARALGPGAPPQALAPAVAPGGAQPVVDVYAAGSWLNCPVAWWGRRHPDQSGFTTRQEWARQEPNNADVQRLWGEALSLNRRWPEAHDTLQHALSLAPNSPDVNLALARVLEQQGLTSKASLRYLTCLKLRPNWLPALLGLGRVFIQSGLKQNALQCYQRATSAGPDSVEAWCGLGRAYQLTDSAYDKSVTAYETALRLAPGDTSFFDDYAVSLYHVSRQDDAESVLRRRLQAAPDDALAHYLLGMVLMNANATPARQAEAEAQTHTALRLSPDNALASMQLAQLYLERGDAKQAIALLQVAVKRKPYNSGALSLLPRAYRQAGLPAQAEQAAAQADRLLHDQQQISTLVDQERDHILDKTLHERLATLYDRVGEIGKARFERDILKLLRTDPQAVARAQREKDAALQQALGGS